MFLVNPIDMSFAYSVVVSNFFKNTSMVESPRNPNLTFEHNVTLSDYLHALVVQS